MKLANKTEEAGEQRTSEHCILINKH